MPRLRAAIPEEVSIREALARGQGGKAPEERRWEGRRGRTEGKDARVRCRGGAPEGSLPGSPGGEAARDKGIPQDALTVVEECVVNIASNDCDPLVRPISRKVRIPDSKGVEVVVILVEVRKCLSVHRTTGGRYCLIALQNVGRFAAMSAEVLRQCSPHPCEARQKISISSAPRL
jgi:hypothetical protein